MFAAALGATLVASDGSAAAEPSQPATWPRDVRRYGAEGDGATNDTVAIQRAIDEVAESGGGAVMIPPGTYRVDATVSVRLRDRIHLLMTPATVLEAIPNAATNYAIQLAQDASDITIEGGILKGERDEHRGTAGEWGMGLSILGSTRVTVRGVLARDCWGDGFYLDGTARQPYVQDVELVDVTADRNRRQGISLISGRNVRIVRPALINTQGTIPQSGLDIEPDSPDQWCEGIRVIDPYTANNAGRGVLISLWHYGGPKPADIEVRGHRSEADAVGFRFLLQREPMTGRIRYADGFIHRSLENPVLVQDKVAEGLPIDIVRPTIVDGHERSGAVPNERPAITVYRTEALDSSTGPIGNVHISEPMIVDTRQPPVLTAGLYVRDATQDQADRISLVNPLDSGADRVAGVQMFAAGVVEDRHGVLTLDLEGDDAELTERTYWRTVHNASSRGTRTVSLGDVRPGWPDVTIEVRARHAVRVIPAAGDVIEPLHGRRGGGIESRQVGARLTLARLDEHTWTVAEQVGSWTPARRGRAG